MAVEDKIIDKSGSWLNYGELRLGQGRENAKQYLRDNPALVEEITAKVLDKRGVLAASLPTASTNGEAPEPPAKPEPSKREGRKQAVAAE
jgi:recombination protein RecA